MCQPQERHHRLQMDLLAWSLMLGELRSEVYGDLRWA